MRRVPWNDGVHGCAELVHTSAVGVIQEASSSDPALMNVSAGATAAWLNTGAPHREQKLRSVSPPWSVPIVVYERSVSPCTLNASRGTAMSAEYGLPVWRWQSVQWHTACITGSASALYVTAPHRQRPVSGLGAGIVP